MERSQFALVAGTTSVVRRDESTSPLRFGGQALSLTISYRRTRLRYTLTSSVSGSSATLTSANVISTERLSTARATVGIARTSKAWRSTRVSIGMEAGADLALTRHDFDGSNYASTNYRFALASIAPTATVEQLTRVGVMRMRLVVPIVGVVDHPYSAVKQASSRFALRATSIKNLHALDAEVSFTNSDRGRIGVVAGYGARLSAFNDAKDVRSLSNSVFAGIILRHGRERD